MRAKELLIAGTLMGLISWPVWAAEDDLALARDFFVITAQLGGYDVPQGDALEIASRNLVSYCARTPTAQMSRLSQQTCDEFDGWKAVIARDKLQRALDR